MLRNCFRCGHEFDSDGRFVCPGCRKPKEEARRKGLSVREKQLIGLVRQGKLNKEIAYDLHLRVSTVKVYLSNVFRKTGARNRTHLAMMDLPL